jgi:molybdate transport system ATP-binding protein
VATLAIAARAVLGGFTLAVDTEIPTVGTTVVIGPSGSGKTTLLRVIAGLERSATGVVRLGDDLWMDTAQGVFVPPHRRAVGYVFQDGRLFPHLTVRGNLDYAARRMRAGAPPDRALIERTFDVGKLLSRSASTLSGGEIQRVAVARALLTNPKLLVMDEPLSAIDFQRRAEALAYIERVPEIFGIPVVYVTHAIEEAARLADTLAIMDAGRLVAVGGARAIMARLDLAPHLGRFEAGVILEGTVAGEDAAFGMSLVEIDGHTLQVPVLGLTPGAAVRLRIRARDVSIALGRPQAISIRNIIPVTVAEIVEEAGSAFAELRLDCGSQALRARITRRSVNELSLAPGSEVQALIKSIAVDRQLFAPASGGSSEP